MNHPESNLLNGLKPSDEVFRFVRVERLLEIVAKRKLVLCRPYKWDDPFEDHLSKTIVIHNGERVGFGLTKDFFGQCWTRQKECDGLWRNYTSLDAGIRVGTTAGKLLGVVWDKSNKFTPHRCWAGNVRYSDDAALKAELKGCLDYGHPLTDPSGSGIAQTLLVKRLEFEYEHEVRLLASDPKATDDFKPYAMNPLEFVDNILFAPKMGEALCEAYTDWFVKQGFDSRIISRSKLYDPWKLTIA